MIFDQDNKNMEAKLHKMQQTRNHDSSVIK